MKLQLKEGWTRHISQVPGDKGAVIICAPGATQRSDYAHIVDCIGTPLEKSCGVYARANGGPSCTAMFQAREDAHKWLLSVGSESPWQEVATDAELTAAAEGEGPSIDEDAEACRQHRANLHRIQVIDEAAVNRCRCAWVVTEPPAPRLCAVDRLEAAGWRVRLSEQLPRLVFRKEDEPYLHIRVRECDRVEGTLIAWIDTGAVSSKGDESPGLNAALESLLAKPVGAVTVAQILGVAP